MVKDVYCNGNREIKFEVIIVKRSIGNLNRIVRVRVDLFCVI